jgi:hypothetical protein
MTKNIDFKLTWSDDGTEEGRFMKQVVEPFIPAITTVLAVLTYGARKHVLNDWMNIDSDEFKQKVIRHMFGYKEDLDESGYPHTAHVVADALILLAKQLKEPK